jgi:hypothetical protein
MRRGLECSFRRLAGKVKSVLYVQEFGLNGRNETMDIKYDPIAYTL